MHIYFVTRGINHLVNRFVEDMSFQYLTYPMTVGTGQKTNIAVQLALRPIQTWELVFPKAHLQLVMNTLWKKEACDKEGNIMNRKEVNFPMAVMRKQLGAKKLPPMIPGARLPVNRENIGFYPIGYKDDKNWEDDPKNRTEML